MANRLAVCRSVSLLLRGVFDLSSDPGLLLRSYELGHRGQGEFIGLQNYAELIHDRDFWASVGHTIYFIVLTVVPNTAVAFCLHFVVRLKRLRLPILSAFFLPFVLPVSVVTTAALWIFDTNFGIANYLLNTAVSWFQDPT